jgi:hypothetical protein
MAPTPDSDEALFRQLLTSRAWRLRNLYWIRDKDGREVKFRPNDAQDAIDRNLHTLNIVLKARQRGITTWACIRALDIALFRSNTACGLVFHTLTDATNAFRDKILYAYERLPESLKRARRVVRKDNTGDLELSNGSQIKVSLSHRSGTLQWLHISEYGKICARDPLRAKEIQSGALNTVSPGNYVTIESTAEGAFGDFYKRCQRAMEVQRKVAAGTAKMTELDYRLFFLPWYEDPTYQIDPSGVEITDDFVEYFDKLEADTGAVISAAQRAWYVKKHEDQGDLIYREYPSTPEEAFKAAKDGSYFGRLMERADTEGRICRLPVLPHLPVHVFWDIGTNDVNVLAFMQDHGGWLNWIYCYGKDGEGLHHFAGELRRLADKHGWVYGWQYLPHDAGEVDYAREDRKSRKAVLESLGFRCKIVPRIGEIGEGIEMTRQMLPRCRFDTVGCGDNREGQGLISGLRAYRKQWDEKTATYRDYPLHDWSSNYVDAIRQAAQGYEPEVTRRESKRSRADTNWKVI